MTAAVPSSFDPQTAQNLEDIEKQFAVKAVLHAQIYWNVLSSRRASTHHLTNLDDQIYSHVLETFPDFDPAVIDEDEMKSPKGKEKWRDFMMAYEKTVEDYNFGTLLRRRADAEYEEHTTMFAPRMQFYAIEIVRNRKGLNDWVYEQAQKGKKGEGSK